LTPLRSVWVSTAQLPVVIDGESLALSDHGAKALIKL
jgi:hypothetical protein